MLGWDGEDGWDGTGENYAFAETVFEGLKGKGEGFVDYNCGGMNNTVLNVNEKKL